MGTIYKRGEAHWVKYYDGHGRPLYESSKSAKMMEANKLLSQREGELQRAEFQESTSAR